MMLSETSFVLGLLSGVFYAFINYPKEEGGVPITDFTIYPIIYRGSIIVSFYSSGVHLHHWLISLLILCFIFYNNNSHITSQNLFISFFTGFLIPICIHGLTYKDRFCFFQNNPYIPSH